VDKTAAKLPRFGEELNSIARISAGITCGAIRPACGAALGWRLVHLNAETVNEFRHHALHLRNKHDSVRATAAQPVLHGDCGIKAVPLADARPVRPVQCNTPLRFSLSVVPNGMPVTTIVTP
jgi:hypothetical protein